MPTVTPTRSPHTHPARRSADRRRAGAWLVLLLTVAVAVMAGCGIQPESEPRDLPSGVVLPGENPEPVPTSTDEAVLDIGLWFVREGQITPTLRAVESVPSTQALLDLLTAGPTEAEVEEGMRTAVVSVLTGEPLVVTAEAAGVDLATTEPTQTDIVLRPEFAELPGEEQLLVLGQVVTTIAIDSIDQVLFVSEAGEPLAVPLPDGRVADGPVTPQDYAGLRE